MLAGRLMFRNKVSRIDWHPLCPPPRSISNKEYLADRIRMTRRIRQDDNQTGMHVTRARHCFGALYFQKNSSCYRSATDFRQSVCPTLGGCDTRTQDSPSREFGAAYSMWSLS